MWFEGQASKYDNSSYFLDDVVWTWTHDHNFLITKPYTSPPFRALDERAFVKLT